MDDEIIRNPQEEKAEFEKKLEAAIAAHNAMNAELEAKRIEWEELNKKLEAVRRDKPG